MTHMHKVIVTAIATVSLGAFAGTTSGTSSSTSSTGSSMATGTTSGSGADSSTVNSATGDSNTTMADQTSTTASQMMGNPATIRQVQQALMDNGHDIGRVDGVWGTRSSQALGDFQRTRGIRAPSSGALDQQTLNALGIQATTSAPTGNAGRPQTPSDWPMNNPTRQGRSPGTDMIDDDMPTDANRR